MKTGWVAFRQGFAQLTLGIQFQGQTIAANFQATLAHNHVALVDGCAGLIIEAGGLRGDVDGLLTIVGIGLLLATNGLTVALAAITWLTYVVVYTPLKKRSTLALYLGGIPGALPFAGGWTAVRGTMDIEAWALFAILFFWQIPRFLALSWMYRQDYASGGFVMHAVEDAEGRSVGVQMIVTSALTMAACVMPAIIGTTGYLYGIVALLGGAWLVLESVRFFVDRQTATARRVLLTSYAVLMGVVFLMFLDKH